MDTNTNLIDHNWDFVQSLFPIGWEELARKTRSVLQFKGGVNSLPDLMRIFLMHLAGGFSLEETVTKAELAGLGKISDVTLMKRLQNSVEWFRQMNLMLIDEKILASPYVGEMTIKLVDATHIKEPGKTGSEWRLHYALTIPELRCDHFELTPSKGEGNGETVARFPISPGDCLLGDRAYATTKNVEYVHQNKGKIVVRMNQQSLPLYSDKSERINLLEILKGITEPGQTAEVSANVHGNENIIPGRLCLIRKDDKAICEAHKKLKRRAQRKQHVVRDETWEIAKYVLVFTTLSKEKWSASQVLELYRFRWQIELGFKRFKSLAELGHVPKYDDQSARAWLLGKLFICLLTEKLISMADSFSPWGLVGIKRVKR